MLLNIALEALEKKTGIHANLLKSQGLYIKKDKDLLEDFGFKAVGDDFKKCKDGL